MSNKCSLGKLFWTFFSPCVMRVHILKASLITCLLLCCVLLEALSGTNIFSSSSLLIAGYSTVNITCSAAAGITESVEWMKESKPVTSDDRIILSADKKTLTIVKVVKEDAGSYKCQLKNKVNKDESTYVMVINCKYPREERSIEILFMWAVLHHDRSYSYY